jgi:hypothetical protein
LKKGGREGFLARAFQSAKGLQRFKKLSEHGLRVLNKN